MQAFGIFVVFAFLFGMCAFAVEHGNAFYAAAAGVAAVVWAVHGARTWRRERRLRRCRLIIPTGLLVDDVAPHLQALRDHVRRELFRADDLATRMPPHGAATVCYYGARAHEGIDHVERCLRNLWCAVETFAVIDEGRRRAPPPPARPGVGAEVGHA